MPDDFEMAQQREEQYRAAALLRFHANSPLGQAGRKDCEECGDPISKPRRKAVPSATRCVGCQRDFERLNR